MMKYQQITEICSKKLEIHGFLVYHPSNNGHVTEPRADKVSKIVLEVVQDDFANICKKSY